MLFQLIFVYTNLYLQRLVNIIRGIAGGKEGILMSLKFHNDESKIP